jgi:hypothetical protein
MTSRTDACGSSPTPTPAAVRPLKRAAFAAAFSIASGLFLGFSPASLSFWDAGRSGYWRHLYIPGERARQFAKIEAVIPRGARVASTDFVHPRFTHYERSYDYSDYRRRVAEYEDRVPDDTEYIVIDTRHPYSRIQSVADVRELQAQPDEWELLPDETDGHFLILKRRPR